VLEVAASLFRTRGYDAATAREIAAALGIQKASLYHHTRGKGALLYQVCAESLRRIRHDVDAAALAEGSPIERVRRVVAAHVTSLLRDQDQHATSLLEIRALSDGNRAKVAALRDAHEHELQTLIERAQQAGGIRAAIPAHVLTLFLLSLTNRSMLWFRKDGPLTAEAFGQIFASIFLTGVAAVPAAR
jgi:AcrR family transcriptional regulator